MSLLCLQKKETMKTKTFYLGATVLVTAFLVIACNKKSPNVAPVADTDTQTAVDAAWATYIITDVDQICAFMGEDQFDANFYLPRNNSGNNYEVVRDLNASQKAITWRNGPVLCVDGRQREGSIFIQYGLDVVSNPNANANSRYYRDFGFVANIAFQDFRVDGWQIDLFDPSSRAYIYNKMSTDVYDPKTQRLTWLIAGKFLIKHPSDPSKNIVWDGKLYKVLVNSTDKDIFNPSKQVAINWKMSGSSNGKAGLVNYYGHIEGSTSVGQPFEMDIKEVTPLVRDFNCTADEIAAVDAATSGSATVFRPAFEEHHPFIQGIASFTTTNSSGSKYPRQIYFGNEGSPDQPVQCDNTGVVLIKGNSYPINFRK
jgi:hypothetical protein